ncbi:hypothetical protein [Microbacterium panaciterrae]
MRRTKAELADLDDAIFAAAKEEHPVTLRGIFYRVVSMGAIDKTEKAYEAVGRRLLALRRSGQIPYRWITDGTRLRWKPETWGSVDALLDNAASSYRRALWDNQDAEIIFISEKDAISGVVHPITDKWDVELSVTRGYTSETFVESISQTVIDNDADGKTTFIYQLGDHDPSGVDAWRDFTKKMNTFTQGASVKFERIAVTPAQIVEYNLSTRPTKKTDTRAANFVGDSVEVDAIPPSVLRRLVEDAILRHLDEHQYLVMKMAEESERSILLRMRGMIS